MLIFYSLGYRTNIDSNSIELNAIKSQHEKLVDSMLQLTYTVESITKRLDRLEIICPSACKLKKIYLNEHKTEPIFRLGQFRYYNKGQ